MTTLLSRPAREIAPARPLDARIETRLRRFRPGVQPAVRALACKHQRLGDLALSFPALLFALAVPRAGVDVRAGVARVIAGDTLAALAHLTGVPIWLRKAPPEAFETPLPVLPDTANVRRRIVNHLPQAWKRGPQWLERVANMARWSDEEGALWLAREMTREWSLPCGRRDIHEWRLLALWIWQSAQTTGRARALIASPFNPAMSFDAASAAAHDFRENLLLHLHLGDAHEASPWLTQRMFDGYTFEPLDTYEAIAAEARAMRHCVRHYGDDVAHDRCRLYSMRKDGVRVATLRVAMVPRQPLPQLVELQGEQNADLPKAVWWAARRWLDSHDLPALQIQPLCYDSAPFRQPDWIALWRPYWLAKGRVPPWLPLRGSRGTVHCL